MNSCLMKLFNVIYFLKFRFEAGSTLPLLFFVYAFTNRLINLIMDASNLQSKSRKETAV